VALRKTNSRANAPATKQRRLQGAAAPRLRRRLEGEAMTVRDKSSQLSSREVEDREWRESLQYVLQTEGPERVRQLLRALQDQAQRDGVVDPQPLHTPYINTISREQQPPFPGSREIERRIKSLVRWNAMAMVVRANLHSSGIGGHISTFASAANLLEVGFNHFFRGKDHPSGGDMIFIQGHASPGIYARAFLEGRLTEQDLENFRREISKGGLPSYPHPRLMPDFWEFPTVSMGLSPIMSIYQARFNQYLVDRNLVPPNDRKVWAFLGDGEMDEPESLGAITLASREQLENLIWVVNCNLQRLDGPVRGNGKIIQELAADFRGAGWNVIKVIWGDDWEPLLARDQTGALVRRMGEIVDGQSQHYTVSSGGYIREDFFGRYPELAKMVENYSDEQLRKMRRGGHDPEKVYAAYQAAVNHRGSPTVVLALTIKGYGLGEAGEGRNITHQQKKLNEQELREFRSRFGIPISDDDVAAAPFYLPHEDSTEITYLKERRRELGGSLPERRVRAEPLPPPPDELFAEYLEGTGEREVATTMVMVHMLGRLLRDKTLGKLIVPIIPDEARTFGLESLFRQVGIYSHVGQLYDPVDKGSLLFYNEKQDGAILEEGITEAGAMSSFMAAGTAYANHGIHTIPFYFFYSMFGFQRIGDLIWAAGDIMARGFLLGATSGRTTLAGEGLQHQDGQSHMLALTHPGLRAYDPAYAYELAVIVQDGLQRMVHERDNRIYYLTVMNEFYRQPPMPKGVREGILRGIYLLQGGGDRRRRARANLLASGAILNEALAAQRLLEDDYGVTADVYSVPGYKQLYDDGIACERWNRLHPAKRPRVSYLSRTLAGSRGVFVASSDYQKALPAVLARWIPGPLHCLGTDGFGRSDGRAALRDYYEVDARHIALAALHELVRAELLKPSVLQKACKKLQIDPEKVDPASV
jgi:pyruvate dehydrogenase E1 component